MKDCYVRWNPLQNFTPIREDFFHPKGQEVSRANAKYWCAMAEWETINAINKMRGVKE